MKRAELTVGQEYWYSNSLSWEENTFLGCKIIVVDLGFWQKPDVWSRDNNPRKTTKGSSILVDMVTKYESRIVRKVVSLAHIRGPYEETYKKIKEWEDRVTAQRLQANERRKNNSAEAEVAIALAKEYGITAHRGGYENNGVTISATDLTELIEKAKLGKLYEASIPW
jgi:hypothetical protein